VQRSTIGVGPALRRARQARGVSVAEASRDTKIRQEFIEALEDERFDRLLGDVYIRGALRSYSTYLGLPADRVLSRYSRSAGEPPAVAPVAPPSTEPVVGAPRRRDNHWLIVMLAVIAAVVAAAFGVFSRAGAPPAAESSAQSLLGEPAAPGITVSVSTPKRPVDVTVRIDGARPRTFSLLAGESRAFVADDAIKVHLSRGGIADVVVNGTDLGAPGIRSHAWNKTFSYRTGSGVASVGASASTAP
jgi:cytoskeleton protein RodZ